MSSQVCRKHYLDIWEEATGILVDVHDRSIIFEDFISEIVVSDDDLLDRLSSLIGERVSVLRTDSKDSPYRIIISDGVLR